MFTFVLWFCEIAAAMVKEITGGYKIAYPANGPDQPPTIIDFTPPFKRISMIKGIEEAAKISIPTDLEAECTNFLDPNCNGVSPLAQHAAHTFLARLFLYICSDPSILVRHLHALRHQLSGPTHRYPVRSWADTDI